MEKIFQVTAGGKVVAREMAWREASTLAESTPGATVDIDPAAAAAYYSAMADAAYGCGATLMGQSYAESAESARAKGRR